MMDISDSADPTPATTPANAQRVLVLQGGGALGSYQAGAYQALCHHDFEPEWVAGISIGAINAAIIAGNPPEKRVDQLRAFWDLVTGNPLGSWPDPWFGPSQPFAGLGVGDIVHGLLDQFSTFQAFIAGAKG